MDYGIGDEKIQAALRLGVYENRIQLSTSSTSCKVMSPYSTPSHPWNVNYPVSIRDGNIHYFVLSIDCTEIYNFTNTSELEGYEGDFYSSKVFVDGELVYDTYYSTEQYDDLKNNQETLNLKYFTLGRCSMSSNGWWHYAKMHTYCMRLYNRGLSEEEITENYNTTKAYYSSIIGN